MSTTRILNSTPAVLPSYTAVQVNASVRRRKVAEVLPVYFAHSVGYLPIPVYIKVSGIEVSARVIYPLDQIDVEASDIGNIHLNTKVTVEWSPEGLKVKSLLILLNSTTVEMPVTSV